MHRRCRQGGRVERCFLFVVEPQRIGAEREEVAREADVGAFECGLELLEEVVGAAVTHIKTAALCRASGRRCRRGRAA